MATPRGRRPGTPSWGKRKSEPGETIKFAEFARIKLRKSLGSLPIIAHYLAKAGIATIVSDACPVAPQSTITTGEAIVALVANRLTAPRHLYRVEEWAQEYAVQEYLGLDPETLNDDRLAAALDAIVAKADEIQSGVALTLQSEFGVNLSQIHLDWTKVIFHGVYENQDPDFAQIVVGAPSATVPKGTKVLNTEMSISNDGGVPLRMVPHSGSKSDVTTVISAFEWLRKVADPAQLLLVGDSKLLSQANEHAVLLGGHHFLAPATWNAALEKECMSLPVDGWQLLPYVSERASLQPEYKRRRFYGQESTEIISIPVDKDGHEIDPKKQKPHKTLRFVVRKVFIHSEEERDAARKSRNQRLQRTLQELEHLQKTVTNYRTVEQLSSKIAKILAKRKLTPFVTFNVTGEERDRPKALEYTVNKRALEHAEKADGYYVLRTNAPVESASIAQVLVQFKGQSRIESRFADIKGPLQISPVYLKSNERAVALLLVVMLAFQVYSLIERDIRRTLNDEGGRMAGLYPEGRMSRPTTRQILRIFEHFGMSWIEIRGQGGWLLDPLTETQREVLRKLGVDVQPP